MEYHDEWDDDVSSEAVASAWYVEQRGGLWTPGFMDRYLLAGNHLRLLVEGSNQKTIDIDSLMHVVESWSTSDLTGRTIGTEEFDISDSEALEVGLSEQFDRYINE